MISGLAAITSDTSIRAMIHSAISSARRAPRHSTAVRQQADKTVLKQDVSAGSGVPKTPHRPDKNRAKRTILGGCEKGDGRKIAPV
jgi:hypothetical protein